MREQWYVDAGLYLEPRDEGPLAPVVVSIDINHAGTFAATARAIPGRIER